MKIHSMKLNKSINSNTENYSNSQPSSPQMHIVRKLTGNESEMTSVSKLKEPAEKFKRRS